MKKETKWALIGFSCLLLANIVRSCAPKYEATNAQTTNNPTPAYSYREYFENTDDEMENITGVIEEPKRLR